MKYWITKYALTTGIQVVDAADPNASNYPNMLVVLAGGGRRETFHGEGRDWHRTAEAALVRAEVMRKAKIASLTQKIKQLEALDIRAPREVVRTHPLDNAGAK